MEANVRCVGPPLLFCCPYALCGQQEVKQLHWQGIKGSIFTTLVFGCPYPLLCFTALERIITQRNKKKIAPCCTLRAIYNAGQSLRPIIKRYTRTEGRKENDSSSQGLGKGPRGNRRDLNEPWNSCKTDVTVLENRGSLCPEMVNTSYYTHTHTRKSRFHTYGKRSEPSKGAGNKSNRCCEDGSFEVLLLCL